MSEQTATEAHTGEGDAALESPEPGVHEHYPSEREYVKVAIVLFALTSIEVAIYYITDNKHVLVPVLLSLAVVKFALVALWFMHLRFDSKLFRRLFSAGIGLAIGVYVIALASLHVWSR